MVSFSDPFTFIMLVFLQDFPLCMFLSVWERRQLGFVMLNGNLVVSRWVGLAYDR